MKICVVGWWYDYLPIMQMLNQYNHHYYLVHDAHLWPSSEQSLQRLTERLIVVLDHLMETYQIDYFVLPPLFEQSVTGKDYPIMSIFFDFLHKSMQRARIGKVWIITTHHSLETIQSHLTWLLHEYQLTPQQERTRTFHRPCSLWLKECRFIPTFVPLMAKSDWMVRKKIKDALRFFKDAAVDVLIPYSWEVLYYEKVVTHMLSARMVFAGSDMLRDCLTEKLWVNQEDAYSCSIIAAEKPRRIDEKKRYLPISKWWTVQPDVIEDSSV
jgi:hypothetical protein